MRFDVLVPWQFDAFSPLHGVVLVAIALLCAGLAVLGDARPRLAVRLAAGLLAIGVASATAFDLLPSRVDPARSLPLHVCDVASIAGVLGLALGWRPGRTILYAWGLTLCSFALAMPVVREGPRFVDFWVYWGWHAAIFVAISTDVVAGGYRPTWRDAGVAAASLVAYGLVALPVNALVGGNYGYIGDDVGPRSFVTQFGPWPGRLAVMLPIAVAMIALSVLPWTLVAKRKQPAVEDECDAVVYRLPLADATLRQAA